MDKIYVDPSKKLKKQTVLIDCNFIGKIDI